MILHRYLFGALLRRLAVALPGLLLLALAADLSDQGRRLAQTLGWAAVLGASLLHLPLLALQFLPVALLLAASLALATLRRRGELLALCCAGIHPLRLWPALLGAGALATLFALGLGELAVPPSERAADRLWRGERVSALTGLAPPSPWLGLPGSAPAHRWLMHLDGERLLALELRGALPTRRLELNVGPGQASGLLWEDPARPPRAADASHLPPGALERTLALRGQQRGRAEALSSPALFRRLRALERAGQYRPAEWLVLHSKLAYPLLNLVLALWACAALTRRGQPGVLQEVLRGLGLLVLLWLLLAGGWTLARVGWLSPAGGAWLPLALAAGAGVSRLIWGAKRAGL